MLSFQYKAVDKTGRPARGALDALGVMPDRALMVGDSWLTDGGAAAIGITALILPARDRTAFPALASVLERTR